MRRAIPLLKMVMRMVGGCIALGAVSQVLIHAVLWRMYGWPPINVLAVDILVQGAVTGFGLAIPMALATLVFFRKIRRPFYYRFAMMTLALIITIALWVGPTLEHEHLIDLPWMMDGFVPVFGIWIGGYALAVFWSAVVAGKYTRETWARMHGG